MPKIFNELPKSQQKKIMEWKTKLTNLVFTEAERKKLHKLAQERRHWWPATKTNSAKQIRSEKEKSVIKQAQWRKEENFAAWPARAPKKSLVDKILQKVSRRKK
jgi:hypothetical protein